MKFITKKESFLSLKQLLFLIVLSIVKPLPGTSVIEKGESNRNGKLN